MTMTSYLLIRRAIELEVDYEGAGDLFDFAGPALFVLELLGIIASLKFMHDIRRRKSHDPE